MNKYKQPLIAHSLAFGVFFLILFVFFKPSFEGKLLPQNDVLQGLSSSKEALDFRAETGEEALWTNSMFSGMPTYIINTHYSGDWVMAFNYKLRFLPIITDAVFINFLGFYIFLLCLGVSPLICFLGASSYAFAPFSIISAEAGHIYKILAVGYLPIFIGGLVLILKRQKYLLGAAVTTLGVGLSFASQHYQIVFYAFLLGGVYCVVKGIELLLAKQIPTLAKSAIIILFTIALGFGPGIGRTWGIMEYNPYSIRGQKELKSENKATSGLDKEYAFAWSQGVWETMTLVVPNLYGGASGQELDKKSETYQTLRKNNIPTSNIKSFCKNVPTYWGDQPFTAGPVYFGIIFVALFILCIFSMPKQQYLWLLVGAVFFTLLALGDNFSTFNYFLFDYVPMFNKFRAVAMALTITTFCFIGMACLGLNAFFELENDKKTVVLKKTALWSLGVLGVVYLFGLFMSFTNDKDATYKLPEWLLEAIISDRKSMFQKDAFRSLFFIGLLLTALYLYIKNTLSKNVTIIVIAAVALLDIMMINSRYISHDKYVKKTLDEQVPFTAADRQILEDKDPNFRVFDLNNPFNNALTSYHHKSIGGYHGAKMQRYQDLIERHLSQNNQKVLDILNCKYILTNQAEQPVFERRTQNGNAWFVKNVTTVNSPDEEIEALNTFDQYNDAVVDVSKFKTSATTYSKDESASIKLDSYKPNHLTYTATNTGNGLALFSEIYYAAGWNAYIDGKPTNHIRCDYILRGLEVPAGTHKIEFKFEPVSYHTGNKISLIASILVFGLLLGAVGWEVKKGLKKA